MLDNIMKKKKNTGNCVSTWSMSHRWIFYHFLAGPEVRKNIIHLIGSMAGRLNEIAHYIQFRSSARQDDWIRFEETLLL